MQKCNSKNRILALLLAMAMVFSLLPATAFAVPEAPAVKHGTGTVNVLHEKKYQPSMCQPLFGSRADISVSDGMATVQFMVICPIPSQPDQGENETVTSMKITYGGQQYEASSDIETKPTMTAVTSNQIFNIKAGQKYPAQILTVTLPEEALAEEFLMADASVGPPLNNTVRFRFEFSNLNWDSAESFPFGSDETMLEVGHYALPIGVYRSTDHERAEYNQYFRGATLDVNADGSAKLTLLTKSSETNLGTMWLADWQYFDQYWIGDPETEGEDFLNDKYLHDFTVDAADEAGHATQVSCTLPYTDQDGIYIQVHMFTDSQKFVKLDFANAVKDGEPVAPNPPLKPSSVSSKPDEPNFDDSINVTLDPGGSDFMIMYTLDGTTPSLEHGTEYTEPFRLTETTLIKAITYNREHTELCGGITEILYYTNADKAAVDQVEALLSKLYPASSITIDKANDVKAAREAYDQLTEPQKVYAKKNTGCATTLANAEAKIEELEAAELEKPEGYYEVSMLQDNKDLPSMCNPLFHALADVTVQDENAVIHLYVFNPVPGFADQGADGTVKNVKISYGGQTYSAVSNLEAKPLKAARETSPLFGLNEGESYPCQTLTFTLPKAALKEAKLDVAAYVNVVMMTDVDFDMRMEKLPAGDEQAAQAVQQQISELPQEITLEDEEAIDAARSAYDKLTPIQRSFVGNFAQLKAAEAAMEVLNPSVEGTYEVAMLQDNKDQLSMCDPLFHALADVTDSGTDAKVELYVFNPVPGFADQGADGTVKNVKISYGGQTYSAVSDLEIRPYKSAKMTNALFGLTEGETYPCQALTFTLPKAALKEAKLDVAAYVNVVMMTDVDFDMTLKLLDDSDISAAAAVSQKIDGIGDDPAAARDAVTAARTEYSKLSTGQKALVRNYEDLTDAEAVLADIDAAAAVDQKISEIGKVTLDSETAITGARDAYKKLTPAQKDLVTKLDDLTAAEEKLEELKAQAALDQEAAAAVDQKIADIGDVTLDSAAAVQNARTAYEGLTGAQKKMVKKLDILTAAEEALSKLRNTAPLEPGRYIVPITAVRSAAPIPAIANAFNTAFGTTAEVEVKSDGSRVITLVPRHMEIDAFGIGLIYHCNVQKLKADDVEATYPGKKNTEQVTVNGPSGEALLEEIQCPSKVVITLPEYVETGLYGYPMQITIDFMNGLMNGDVASDNWMDIQMLLDFTKAEKKPTGGGSGGSGGSGSSGGGSIVIPPVGPEQPEQPEEPEQPEKPEVKVDFTDVREEDFFFEAVQWAVENGITNGTSESTFSPEVSCTRAEMVTFLWRAAGSPEARTEVSFSDVRDGSWYAEAVAWAVENKITSGTGSGKFSPDMICTRSQTVTFLWRAAASPEAAGEDFADVSEDEYYAAAVAWAVENKITLGTGGGKFSPDMDCSRGQIVTFLYRADSVE